MDNHFYCNNDTVVSTKAGKLRGYKLGSTYTFLGIEYAKAKRFFMPEEVTPWEGIKDALAFGYTAPLLEKGNPQGDIFSPHRFWPQAEDCLYLNVWTQSLESTAKKPVMVWLHGGGYMGGSSVEMPAYDGDNLSKFGDVVVVSLNHRLNVLGYLDLSAFGEEFYNSGNAGMADMVAALRWIRDNIANFGGDPKNVTLFGQSGGSGKVHTLLQIPEAADLFQRGIMQSGTNHESALPFGTHESNTRLAEEMMKECGLTSAKELCDLPLETLQNACIKGMEKLRAEGIIHGWGPRRNDWFVGDGIDYDIIPEAQVKPVMIGSTFAEFAFGPAITNKYEKSEEECMELLRGRFGDKAEEAAELFRKAYPNKNITDLLSLDTFLRPAVLDCLNRRAELCSGNCYSYVFAFDFPFDGGRTAWHCAEIPFAFHNAEKTPICNVPGVSEKLEQAVAGAWVNFARSGDPNGEGVPHWEPYTTEGRGTMVFEAESYFMEKMDEELMAFLKEFSAAPGFAL